MGWLRARQLDEREDETGYSVVEADPVPWYGASHVRDGVPMPGPFALCYLSFDTPWMRVRMLGAEFVPPSAADARALGEIASDIPETWCLLAWWPALWSLETGVGQSVMHERAQPLLPATTGEGMGVWLGLCQRLLHAYARLMAWPAENLGSSDLDTEPQGEGIPFPQGTEPRLTR